MKPPATAAAAEAIRVGTFEELQQQGCIVVPGERHAIAVFAHEGKVYAVDNRCPHMGFPLSQGSLKDGILTCHWHHARFDLESGGTFDPFADDVAVYPTEVRDGEVYVGTAPARDDAIAYWKGRLLDSLEQQIPLVTAKAVLALLEGGIEPAEILAMGGRFGARYRQAGWGPGLTILTLLANILPDLLPEDRPKALYHGLVHVADDSAGQPPRFDLEPLPARDYHPARLRLWFRRFNEMRDTDGAERVLRTAIAAGYPPAMIADVLLAAATDHYYHATGHTVDFINKAFEMLQRSGWKEAAEVLPSLIGGMSRGSRNEENQAWRHPIDLKALLELVFGQLPGLLNQPDGHGPWNDYDGLAAVLLQDDPQKSVDALVAAFRQGAQPAEVSLALSYAAALRVARFHTSNEFGDWITVLHTFTYCNALHQSLKRAPSLELVRGIFHGAMSIYLDRFLNMPAARLPDKSSVANEPAGADELLVKILSLMDRQSQVNEVARVIVRYLSLGHPDQRLLQTLGRALLREDSEFHMYQVTEAGFQLYKELKAVRPDLAAHALVAVGRYLAAHTPTNRAMMQTYDIAVRLQRQEDLFVETD